MAQPPILFRETRLPPTPLSPSSILHIDTTAGASQRSSFLRAGNKRSFDEISGSDEETYARKYLATEGSVFFRSKARSPRSFLWRVLADRKELEIQAVDLVRSRSSENHDSWLTYRIEFAHPILQGGVAFADPEETDALECFVLTEGRELFTVTLRKDILTKGVPPSDFDVSTCVKKYASTFLSVRHPYRFAAVSSRELLISLVDGGMVRLERQTHESAAQWRDTFFSEGGWSGTLKGFNPFVGRQTVRYGDLELDPSAIADMSKSPDGKYVWTVSLDHWLRAWSTKSGRVEAKLDLLNQSQQTEGRHQYTMSAEQGMLMQIVTPPSSPDTRQIATMDQDDKYCIVVQSPKDHQFKIYEVSSTSSSIEGEGLRLKDLQPRIRMVPPIDELMNTNIWHLEQFFIHPGFQWERTQLWIRARSGALCKSFMLTFDVLDDNGDALDGLNAWQIGWSVVDAGPLTTDALKHLTDFSGELDVNADDGVTPSERWLSFLFHPGRFSLASLETALHIYRKGRSLPATLSRGIKPGEQPLGERLTASISSKVILRRLPNEQPDYARYQQDLQAQWQTYYSLLSHLHNRRHEPIGLAFDFMDSLPWSICADYVAPVRSCSGLELRSMNAHLVAGDRTSTVDTTISDIIFPERITEDDADTYESLSLTKLMAAAREFRKALSSTAQNKLATYAAVEALIPHEDAGAGRALQMFEKCGLDAEVTDEDFDTLSQAVETLGGLGTLKDDTFLAVLTWLDKEGDVPGRTGGLQLKRYGLALTVQVARETLELTHVILLDLLSLVVFMAGGLEEAELDPEFNADTMYDTIMHRVKRNELFRWLVGHVRVHTEKIRTSSLSQQDLEITSEVTLLESAFAGDCKHIDPHEDLPITEQLSIWGKTWLYGTVTQRDEWDGVTAYVLAHLLKRKEVDLAVDFLSFPDWKTGWSVYLRARVHVATGDYALASIDFKTAADMGIAYVQIALLDTAEYLHEDERLYFGNGLAPYYQHVVAVFEKLKAYSYVADFAYLALDNTEQLEDFEGSMNALDRKKRQPDSPAHERAGANLEEIRLLRIKEIRDEILNRLFNALVQTGRFAEAYHALTQIQTQATKHSNLRSLLDACVKHDAIPALLELPFDGNLAREADKALLAKAKSELKSGNADTQSTALHQILYAFRTQRSDFRGAAEILYEHLERLRHMPQYRAAQDPEDETLLQAYVLLINTLACCGEEDAWLLADPLPGVHREGNKRKLVTLADIRREYTAELDKRSDLLHGRFALVGDGDEMDVL